jgi:hypothetical protein
MKNEMSKNTEKLHLYLADMMEQNDCNIFEAVVDFCSEHEIEIEDFISQCDELTVKRIRQCAIEEHMIRKQNLPEQDSPLPFE